MSGSKTSWGGRTQQERALIARLERLDGPRIDELTFRKQSHNAVVYHGVMNGAPVFVKEYETDYGRRLVEKAVEETEVVLAHFEGRSGGIARIEWANSEAKIVVMSQVLGRKLMQAAQGHEGYSVFTQVAQWLKDYVGPRVEVDKYPTRYWYKKRMKADLDQLNDEDQALVVELLALQRIRATGPIVMKSGRVPSDFAPHNLHCTEDEIFGFDIEGNSRQPLARAAVWFAILASRRIEVVGERRFGLPSQCIVPFMEVLDVGVDDDQLWQYLVADLMFARFTERYEDERTRTTLRAAIISHLETS